MAAFTSVITGNWNDGATWGNASPGVKGIDWPGAIGDTFTVSAGDEVTYNVSETNELGASVINGTLTFRTNINTKLTFGDVTLTISATGVLNVGSAGTPVNAANTAEIIFNTTSDGAQGINIINGGHMYAYGDPAYVSDFDTTLADDPENTDGDADIKTNDDMSLIWHVGDEITLKLERMGDDSSYTDAIRRGVIQNMVGTTITLDINVTCQVGVGNTWVSSVINVTRNVKIYKLNPELHISSANRYNTNRPIFTDNTAGVNTNILSNVQISAFHHILTIGMTLTNCIIRNGARALTSSNNNIISGNIYCCEYGFVNSLNNTVNADIYAVSAGFLSSNLNTMNGNIYSSNYGFYTSNNNTLSGNIYSSNLGFFVSNKNIVSGDIYLCVTAFYSFSNNGEVSGNIYSCTIAFYDSNHNNVSANIYSCTTAFQNSSSNVMSGKLGYDAANNSLPNTNDLMYSDCIFMNCRMPAAGIVLNDRNTIGGTSFGCSEHDDKTLNSHKVYQVMGDVIRTACNGAGTSPTVDPDGGNGYCVEISNLQLNLSTIDFVRAFNDYEYSIYTQAAVARTYTFYIQSTFAAILQNTEIRLEAKYLNAADGALTILNSVQTVTPRANAADWSQFLRVTVNPLQTGFVYFQIRLFKYEAGRKLYIWPRTVIT